MECQNVIILSVSTVFTGMSRAISGIMHFISCWFFDIDIQCNDIVPSSLTETKAQSKNNLEV